jgi:hypothetical protein
MMSWGPQRRFATGPVNSLGGPDYYKHNAKYSDFQIIVLQHFIFS